jgi:hypothetical protein
VERLNLDMTVRAILDRIVVILGYVTGSSDDTFCRPVDKSRRGD